MFTSQLSPLSPWVTLANCHSPVASAYDILGLSKANYSKYLELLLMMRRKEEQKPHCNNGNQCHLLYNFYILLTRSIIVH